MDGEVVMVTLKPPTGLANAGKELTVRCQSDDQVILSDGKTGVTNDLMFNVSNTTKRIPIFVAAPDVETPVSCTVGGSPISFVVSIHSQVNQAKLLSAVPPINRIPTSAAAQPVILSGTGMSTLPQRILVGPYVVPIEVVNDTYAVATVPPTVTCGNLDAELIAGYTQKDKVFGWRAAAPLSVRQRLDELCNGANSNTLISINAFDWDGANLLNAAPRASLSFNFTASSKKRQTGADNQVILEAGGPSVNLTALFSVANGESGDPLDPTALPLSLQVTTINDSNQTVPVPVSFTNPGSAVISASAPITRIASVPMLVVATYGPYEFVFTKSLGVLRASIAADFVPVASTAPSSRPFKLTLNVTAGTPRQVVIKVYAVAQATVSVTTNDTHCTIEFPSLNCHFQVMDQSTTLGIDVVAPSYYKGPIEIHYAIEGPNLKRSIEEVFLIPGNSAVSPGSQWSGNVTDPKTTNGSDSPSAALPVSDKPAQAAVPPALLRGIFAGSSAVICTDPLVYSVIAFGILFFYAVVIKIARRNDEVVTFVNIPQWRSLLLHHAWVSAVVPCHSGCAISHATQPFAHILTVLLLSAGTANLLPETTQFAPWIIAILSVIVAQPMRFLIGYYYRMWKLDIAQFELEQEQYNETIKQTLTRKIRSTMGSKKTDVAVSNASLAALEDIVLVEEDVIHLDEGERPPTGSSTGVPAPSRRVNEIGVHAPSHFSEDGGEVNLMVDRFSLTSGSGNGTLGDPSSRSGTFGRSGTVAKLRTDLEIEFEDEDSDIDCIELPEKGSMDKPDQLTKGQLQHLGDDQLDGVVPVAPSSVEDALAEPPSTAKVIADTFVIRGHVVSGAYSLILVACTLILLLRLNTPNTCSTLLKGFTWAVILDALVAQTLSVLFVALFRWLVSEDDELMYSELHPRDGERRPY